jgi:hypothetical protein
MNLPSKALAVTLLAATASWFAGSAVAAPVGASVSMRDAAGSAVQDVAWRGRGWWGGPAGFAAGAIIGGAVVASQPWYGYGYDYAPGYYSYGYDPGPYGYAAPGYVAPAPDAVAYCEQRFRSYDPASGTYLGFDGLRHPCP